MGYDRFLIAPFNTGWQTDLRPWLTPEDSFTTLENAYVFRGRVRKRFGGKLMGPTPQESRFRINLGTTDAMGNFPAAPAVVPGSKFFVGQAFSVGTNFFTVVNGAPGPQAMLTTGPGTGTYNVTNGAYTITGAPALTAVFFYPALPVMGLTNYENGPINNQPSFGFDTEFAYFFVPPAAGWTASWTGTFPIWKGNNTQFFWTENWIGVDQSIPTLFVTNFNATVPVPGANDDPIWTFSTATNWVAYPGNGSAQGFYFRPNGLARYAGPFVQTALLIVAFKNRLIFLNTIENYRNIGGIQNVAYPQRARYSIAGSPFLQNSWYEVNQSDTSGTAGNLSNFAGAGYIDASTEEQIVSAEFIKDRLIVYFERSTWELVYTGNQVQPFIWQKINTELGSVSTFSSVPFDKLVMTIGLSGVHACTGANVERIDNKIPDEIFEIEVDEDERVAGIRNYYTEVVYWTAPTTAKETINVFPNQVLIYNYKNDTWAINDDCITAFGYYEQQADITWATANSTWQNYVASWTSGIAEAQFRQIVAGNQEGFTFFVADYVDIGYARNAPVMQITNIVINANGTATLTVINHNLAPDDWIAIENVQGLTNINVDVNPHVLSDGVTVVYYGIYQVLAPLPDVNTIIIQLKPEQNIVGTYTGGGNITRVSNMNIQSKQWNPYVSKDRNVFLAKIDFAVTRTPSSEDQNPLVRGGEVTVDYFPSSSEFSMLENMEPNVLFGNNILQTSAYTTIPFEQVQERLWHPVYFQTEGECIQIKIFMDDEQIANPNTTWQDFEIQGILLFTAATTTRLQ